MMNQQGGFRKFCFFVFLFFFLILYIYIYSQAFLEQDNGLFKCFQISIEVVIKKKKKQ